MRGPFHFNRRRALQGALFAMGNLASGIQTVGPVYSQEKTDSTRKHAKKIRLVLRSSWQTVNIGDIGHTPGVLRLLEEYLPEIEVRLWPSNVDHGVAEMLLKRFPNLQIVQGSEAQKRAMKECDFLLHGSGPSLVAEKDIDRWCTETGKPFGVYGITLPTAVGNQPPSVGVTPAKTIELLSKASFAFFRDSVSLSVAKERGCTCPIMQFAPDGAFAADLENDSKGLDFLRANQLEPGKYLCCIPRLRYTPYWLIHSNRPKDEVKHQRNEAMKEHDHAPLRQAIISIFEQTDYRILLCPEDKSQMAVGKEMILDRLPNSVKKRVAWREEYWLTDEALSIYRRSAGLFGNEMHSPIMCVGNGVPAIVCRFSEQTSKGMMWRDIGLGDWLLDLDVEDDVKRVPEVILDMVLNRSESLRKTEVARMTVQQHQRTSMQILRDHLFSNKS